MDFASLLPFIIAFAAGVLIASVYFLLSRQKLIAESERVKAQLDAQAQAFDVAGKVLDDRFKATAQDALQKTSESFLQLAQEKLKSAQNDGAHDLDKRQKAIDELMKPMAENLKNLGAAIEQVKGTDRELKSDLQNLSRETARLVGALRDPSAQGQWGEFILEGLLEKSGLMKGVHYHTQATLEGGLRPDAIIEMQDGFKIVVDSKAPINQFSQRLSEDLSEADYTQLMGNLARQVREHVKALGKKDYWESLDSVDFTVMFLPSEHIYSIALRADPSLVDFAASKNVIIASPTLLMSLLRVVGMSWRQVELAKNAQEISVAGNELYKRFLKFTDHLGKVGKGLQSAMSGYDAAIGSMEKQVLPAARKFKDLQESAISDDVPSFTAIESAPRQISLTAEDEAEKKRA
ncbi:MAG: DNA recombination protein RmuC [Micavibrio sp.]|nr:DNA recombination protein RmuC [Micavibrio sp.]